MRAPLTKCFSGTGILSARPGSASSGFGMRREPMPTKLDRREPLRQGRMHDVGAGLAQLGFVVPAGGDAEAAGAGGVRGGDVLGRVADDPDLVAHEVAAGALDAAADGDAHELRALGGVAAEAAEAE